MQFNSVSFAVFLLVVFVLHWFFANNHARSQNALLVVASYVFYAHWDWRFLSLIAASSIVDYSVGIGLSATEHPRNRKLLLLVSIGVNLGILGFFKYFDFFVGSFVEAFALLGYSVSARGMDIILPVGISFYTFQTLSYSIDVYRRRVTPTRDILAFFAFVSFFPQLVAGPIERASSLLGQFQKKRTFEYGRAVDGMRQILWGLFKKVVIADNCAAYVNDIFADYGYYSGSTLFLGAFLFAFQIYGDFSGYSDIAIGVSRLFGVNLMRNFAYPYFSRDIAEFWRRWHISLSTWFRDYVYIPLGGSRGRTWMRVRNIFIVFLLSGLWHGANWTFVIWGVLNAIFLLPLVLMHRNRKHTDLVAEHRFLPNLKEVLQMGTTFCITLTGWVFFRAESLHEAIRYLGRVFSASLFSKPDVFPKKTLVFIAAFLCAEWLQRDKQHVLQFGATAVPRAFRWGLYYGLILAIVWFGGSPQEFIYFQF